MRITTVLAAGVVMLALGATTPASAGGWNPEGYGIYTPIEPPVRGRPRLYRRDPRSWYYRGPTRYYPYYASGHWVPRVDMRYRYRYRYVGPKYKYYPAWGYGYAEPCGGWFLCR
jgi:hypothetical protein